MSYCEELMIVLSRFTLRVHGICLQPVQDKLMSVLMIVGIHHTWAACKAGKFASICFSAITQQIPFLKIEGFLDQTSVLVMPFIWCFL